MADRPARRGYEPPADEADWGSPMPAEYGSLTAFLPPLDDPPAAPPAERDPDTVGSSQPAAERRPERRWWSRKAAPTEDGQEPSPNGAVSESNGGPVWAAPASADQGAEVAGLEAARAPSQPDVAPRPRDEHQNGPVPVTGDSLASPAQVERRPTGAVPVTGDSLAGPAQVERDATGAVPVIGAAQAERRPTGEVPVAGGSLASPAEVEGRPAGAVPAGDLVAGPAQEERPPTGEVPVAGGSLASPAEVEGRPTGEVPLTRDTGPGPAYVLAHDGTGSVTRDPLPSSLTTVMPIPVVPVLPPGPLPTAQGEADKEQTRESFGSRRQQRKAARPQWAQSKRTVRHLNVWTVFKVSLAFYFMLLVAVVVASVMLWYVANAFGSIQTIEKSVRTLFDLSKFTIRPGQVLKYTAIGGGILAFCGTFANVLAAFMYNLISDLVGGVRFDVIDEGR